MKHIGYWWRSQFLFSTTNIQSECVSVLIKELVFVHLGGLHLIICLGIDLNINFSAEDVGNYTLCSLDSILQLGGKSLLIRICLTLSIPTPNIGYAGPHLLMGVGV